jgi:lysylphosphatidylglycerol synthetase-like protein (DUF2156 family)
MDKIKITSRIILVKGIFMILLGVFHVIALFIIMDKVLSQLPTNLVAEFMLWFAIGGFFFVFSGIIDLISYAGLKNKKKVSWLMAFTSSTFAFFGSILGIIVIKEGPPFLIFVFGLVSMVPLIRYRKEFIY